MDSARLMYAGGFSDADLFYATRLPIDDPFIWWEWQGETHIILSPLEIDRARPLAQVNHLHAMEEYLSADAPMRSPEAFVEAIARVHNIPGFLVPEPFPSGLLQKMRKRGLNVEVAEKEFFPQRRIKTPQEISALSAALRIAERGLRTGIDILRATQITEGGLLTWNGSVLTSERLRAEMECEVLRAGGLPAHTIVAGGDQGCDPHERGHGPLRAHEAIVLDIFPRDTTSLMFGDLTRTVVRGVASEALRKQYQAVQAGKAWVISQMKAGVDGGALQRELLGRFREQGFLTEKKNGRWQGMFHGVGHGLGLELHEAPRFAAGALFAGFAVTVEPGLYYPGVGGVRLEDVVVVQDNGVMNLTQFEEELEL